MNFSAAGALGAFILAASALPALAGGYYDAGPPGGPQWGPGEGSPCSCMPPGGPGWNGPPPPQSYPSGPPGAYDQGPPPGYGDAYDEAGPGPYDEEAYGPGYYYDEGGMLVPEGPYFGFGYGYAPGFGFGRGFERGRGREQFNETFRGRSGYFGRSQSYGRSWGGAGYYRPQVHPQMAHGWVRQGARAPARASGGWRR